MIERGLLYFDEKNKKFDLHPIVRRYAYDRLTAADRMGAHERLVNYFDAIPKTEKVNLLEDLASVIELYHHMVRAGMFDESRQLYQDHLRQNLFYQFGAYQIVIELLLSLFPYGTDNMPNLKDESAQAWTSHELANSFAMSGQPVHALPLWNLHHSIRERQENKKGLSIGLGAKASIALLPTGALMEAEKCFRQSLELSHGIDRQFHEAVGRQELGLVLLYRGLWNEAETEFSTSLLISERESFLQNRNITWAYRARRSLFIVRSNESEYQQSTSTLIQLSISFARRPLELADETANPNSGYVYPISDYIRAYWLLGAAYRANNELTLAEENLSKALNLCRQINLVNLEAEILLDLARLRYDEKNYEEAKALADEALTITERCGYVLQGADVNLFLAQYALEQEQDKVRTKEYAETALKLATCDGPPYYYKVAYDEAVAMLERLKV
ncbi:MAG: tetratricopeptide repeat protein [Chloroflexota bacterium]|nr:tetratricopeptide repeat protein [Chloroflexota bacterium]